MVIDEKLPFDEIMRSIFNQISNLQMEIPVRSGSEFEKWYQGGKNGPYILYAHPDIKDPDAAKNNCEYPNIWVTYNQERGTLDFGLAFWSTPSVDNRFINLTASVNKKNREHIASILQKLPDIWNLKIYRRFRYDPDEVVETIPCNTVDSEGLYNLASRVRDYREEWAAEGRSIGRWIVPAVNLMTGHALPPASDSMVIFLFSVFAEICRMFPTAQLNKEYHEEVNKIDASLLRMKENLKTSKFADKIAERIKSLEEERARIKEKYGVK